MRSIRALAVAGVVSVLMAACGGGGGGGNTPSELPTGLPSGLPTGLPSGLPTGLPSGLPTGLPSGLPTGLPGTLSTGTAHIEISGSQTATLDLPLKTGAYAPNAAIGLAYQDSAKNTFAIAGVAFTGTAKTSSTLTVSLVSTNPVILATSASGECSLTLTDATSSHVKGTVSCENLSGGLNLTGTYEAGS